jgi:hypothetical protein
MYESSTEAEGGEGAGGEVVWVELGCQAGEACGRQRAVA